MKLPDNNTFCVAPWFQIRNENDGSKRVCCGITSKYPKSVEQEPLEFLNSADNIELKKSYTMEQKLMHVEIVGMLKTMVESA